MPPSACRVRLATVVVALVLGTVLSARPVTAQTVESARGALGLESVWCPDCEVRIREVVALGDAEGPGILEDYVVESRLDVGFSFLDVREGLIGDNVLDGGLVPRYRIYRLEILSR